MFGLARALVVGAVFLAAVLCAMLVDLGFAGWVVPVVALVVGMLVLATRLRCSVDADRLVVRDWFTTVTIPRAEIRDIQPAPYDGGLVSYRLVVLWSMVEIVLAERTVPIRATLTSQRRAVRKCAQLKEQLGLPAGSRRGHG